MEYATNATAGITSDGELASVTYGLFAGIVTVFLVAYSYITPLLNYIMPLFETQWVQDGMRLMLLGSVMETARRFWQRAADRIADSMFTTATIENGDFAFDWVDDYLHAQGAWGFMTAFRVTSSIAAARGDSKAAGQPMPVYQCAADQEEFWRWRGHWLKISKKPGTKHWRTGEEDGGVIRISVYSWRRRLLDELIVAAREHYLQHSKPRLLEDQGAKSESVITAYIEQPDRVFDYLCDFLGSAKAWGNVRQVYVSSKNNSGVSWGMSDDVGSSDVPISLENSDLPIPHDYKTGAPLTSGRDVASEKQHTTDPKMNEELLKRLSKKPKLNYRPAADRPQLFKWHDHWIQVTREMVLHNANRQILDDLIEAARIHFSKAAMHFVTIYLADQYGSWSKTITKARRPLETLILPDGVLETLLEDARDFLASESWYRAAGVPHRRGYLLHGLPGCGKSSTIHALASELMLPIYSISLATKGLDDSALQSLVAETPPECILSIEDIDCAFPEARTKDEIDAEEEELLAERETRRRARDEEAAAAGVELPEEAHNIFDAMDEAALPPRASDVTLSGLLNLIDGVWSEEGRLLFATTNHIEKLDPALIRPGRIDVRVRYDASTRDQVCRMFERFFPADNYPTDAVVPEPRLASSHISVSAPSRAAYENVPRAFIDRDGLHELAERFAQTVPEGRFSPAALQGFLLLWKSDPHGAVGGIAEFVAGEEQVEREREEARSKARKRRKDALRKAMAATSVGAGAGVGVGEAAESASTVQVPEQTVEAA
ncbi:P-loop containing nucleoside triphosphate hydrolase protein [Auriculariales sp. MPI-PUGE-AT-0066]|nr:P-loop containing nucleoside triphosphate hydrolase protein [Auriculariales sp. MPI-PUGE-AT-0066]